MDQRLIPIHTHWKASKVAFPRLHVRLAWEMDELESSTRECSCLCLVLKKLWQLRVMTLSNELQKQNVFWLGLFIVSIATRECGNHVWTRQFWPCLTFIPRLIHDYSIQISENISQVRWPIASSNWTGNCSLVVCRSDNHNNPWTGWLHDGPVDLNKHWSCLVGRFFSRILCNLNRTIQSIPTII